MPPVREVVIRTATPGCVRTVADVRHFFAKSNGNLGENGCVAWMFEKKGQILVDKEHISEEDLMDKALEAGAEDVIEDENEYQVLTAIDDFNDVRDGLEEQGVAFLEASISMIPQNTIEIDDEQIATSLLKLLENLEDHEDVQKVHANFDIDQNLMEKLS
ncbi:MAG: YebC/PmpR family DNA-binding transcriptional regulator [Desulfofustis sp.]